MEPRTSGQYPAAFPTKLCQIPMITNFISIYWCRRFPDRESNSGILNTKTATVTLSMFSALRCVVLQLIKETSSLVQCMNELLQLYLSEVQPRLQLATAQAMYMALDKCSDVVHITDQNLNIQVSVSACLNKGRWKMCSYSFVLKTSAGYLSL
jgi:hypothetical protein